MTQQNQTLYDLIKYYIDRQSLTLNDFAKKIGVTIPTIYRIKEKVPSLKTYHKLANELDIDVWDLRQYPIK